MRIVTVRGIGEKRNINTLSRLGSLPNSHVVDVDWTASYGPVNPRQDPYGESFKTALASGTVKLRAELDKGPALLAGYSGGAALAGNVAAQGHRNIVAVGLVADPFDPGTSKNYGISGRRAIKNKPTLWLANDDDVICRCPHNSPLRPLASVSTAFSLGDPAAWGNDVLAKIMMGRIQPIYNPIKFIQEELRYRTAYVGVCRYLGINPNTLQPGRNAHTDYNFKPLYSFFRRFL